MTDEWKAKIAKANSGKKQPQEVIAKRVISLRKAWENGAYKDRARAATKLPAL